MNQTGVPLVREAVLEGLFYPQRAHDLSEAVANLLLRTEQVTSRSSAIVTPHGSLQYSGLHQAAAFKSCAAVEPKLICIIAPATHRVHRTPAVPESLFFRSPLGDTRVDQTVCQTICKNSTMVVRDDIPHLESPAVEAPLPFIQYLWPHAAVAPILVPELSATEILELSLTLRAAVNESTSEPGKDTLWVASSNITLGGDELETRSEADSLLEQLLSDNPERLIEQLAAKPARLSNRYPSRTVLALLRLCLEPGVAGELLTRGASFDFDGNAAANTEYAAVAFSRPTDVSL